MKKCCDAKPGDKKCIRNSDKKVFNLPRKFTLAQCMKPIKGFSMRASCAAFLNCI